MKNTLVKSIFTIGLIWIFGACTQTEKPDAGADKNEMEAELRKSRIAHNTKIFKEASDNGDSYAALNATYALLADDTTNRSKYLDTLAALYVKLNMAAPAMKIADKILAKDPANEKMLDLKATGSLSMGNSSEALNINRRLYEKEKKVKYLFKIASVQLEGRNYKDLEQTVKQIENHPDLAKDSLELPTDVPGKLQKIPNTVAIIYLKGLIAGEKQNYAEAKKQFQKAVKMQPDFFMAKQYLQALSQPQQPPMQP